MQDAWAGCPLFKGVFMVTDLGRLVISRDAGESVRIGDNITIEVIKINHGRVRLAIVAPKDVRVIRSELEEEDAA